MSRWLRWVVPDLIEPTELDTAFLAISNALAELPYVLQGALRKAMLAPSWSDFHDMATADERNVLLAMMRVGKAVPR